MEYGTTRWDPYRIYKINSLERIQYMAAKFVKGKREDGNDTIKELKWETLENRRRKTRITSLYRAHLGQKAWVDITARLEKPTYYGRNDHDFKIKCREQKTDVANQEETIQCLTYHAIYARDVERFCSPSGWQKKVSLELFVDDSKEYFESQNETNPDSSDTKSRDIRVTVRDNSTPVQRIHLASEQLSQGMRLAQFTLGRLRVLLQKVGSLKTGFNTDFSGILRYHMMKDQWSGEKFSPAPEFEPGFSALRADALSTKPHRITIPMPD
ncbi:hypothetical protein ANN_04188 [Periplaneta americana]|uniref:Uncharacterized protein n=1 Tax=Periplaneta americana TaxID=6978 RepID=A0ABQ8T7W6_PERAM|nr:hypothetical protein ANN_04188 [Periplaneta americana]